MLKRKMQEMPDFVKETLISNGVMQDFNKRPDYQRNDYLGWINRASKEETKQKRLIQMIDELKRGGVYMNMIHGPSKKD